MKKTSKLIQDMPMEVRELFKNIEFIAFDFDGVFTDNTVIVDENGKESVKCSRLDGIGLNNLRKVGVKSVILSSEVNNLVNLRSNKLKVNCKNGLSKKVVEFENMIEELGIDRARSSFLGNDTNDIDCLKIAGLPIVVPDSHLDVLHLGKYITQKKGGNGAVREVCDIIEALK
jgi:YrbI family 3-deoxy-D-manno-octulosonate 8-phosphate phosphatase